MLKNSKKNIWHLNGRYDVIIWSNITETHVDMNIWNNWLLLVCLNTVYAIQEHVEKMTFWGSSSYQRSWPRLWCHRKKKLSKPSWINLWSIGTKLESLACIKLEWLFFFQISLHFQIPFFTSATSCYSYSSSSCYYTVIIS